jgi:hypothetical protein
VRLCYINDYESHYFFFFNPKPPHTLNFNSTRFPIQAFHMIHLPLEPLTFRQAAAKPEWYVVISSEYSALMNNQTWTFYP